MLSRDFLRSVAASQEKRNVNDKTINNYLSKMKVLTNILNNIDDLRSDVLVLNDRGEAEKHTGRAKEIYKLKFPVTAETGQYLFAAISIDGNLPRKRRISQVVVEVDVEEEERLLNDDGIEENEDEVVEIIQSSILADGQEINPGDNIATVSSQTYQNYKSALKWWHKYNNEEWEKIGYPFPSAVDEQINCQIATYKRDVGKKKRRGVFLFYNINNLFTLFLN